MEPTKVESPADIRKSNKEILAQLVDSDEGPIKFASAAGSKMLRRRIYEEGFLRQILPEETVTDEDLTPQIASELPSILKEMEPLSKGAKSVPFGDSPEVEFYRGDKYLCVFNPITTPDYTKDLNELRTYQGDLRQLVTNNALIHMQTEEDSQFINTVNTICGPTPGTASTITGLVQNYNIAAGITRTSYPDILKILTGRNLNNGVILMNRVTALEFLKWKRDEVGGDLAEKLYKMGLKAWESAELFGVKHIFTTKRALVPDGTVYLLSEPGFLGHFMSLQQPIMTVKKERDIITFGARETVSCTLANVTAMAKVQFTSVSAFPADVPALP